MLDAQLAVIGLCSILPLVVSPLSISAAPPGPKGVVGTQANPKRVQRLLISKPGLYENYLVDSGWQGGNRVKVSADNVTIRNCEIRNASGNGIGVFGTHVVIENCKIHHMLAGSFQEQRDAHGITGRWGNVTIRNCDIGLISGDCIQFDPDRQSTGRVLIEGCRLWTGRLPVDAAQFKKGQRPGENAVDTKTPPGGRRAELVIRNCLLHGWKQPGQIGLMAALNLKENVTASVDNCLFYDNQVALRLRGPTRRGGAWVRVSNCAVYRTQVGVRAEDTIANLKIRRLGFAATVNRQYHTPGCDFGPGYENSGPFVPPPIEDALRKGLK
ncbi:MAG: right-handed parallel beta-helix repeat-containing protein [Planctomycetaceae bacterium]